MLKKFLCFLLILLIPVVAVGGIYHKFIRQNEFNVFVESYSHGVVSTNAKDKEGTDKKYKVTCKSGKELVLTIDADKGYKISSLMIDGNDVTKDISKNKYTLTVEKKLSIVATFKKA